MDIQFDIPPGLNSDDTTYSASPAWSDICNMRFREKRPQTIGGWESLTTALLTGVCRAVLAWTENTGVQDVAFGTHTNLQLFQGGVLADITPFGPQALLGSNPLSVTNASAVVTVSHAAHGYANGISVIVANAAAIGGITPNGGPFVITVIDANTWSYVFTAPATSTVAGGGGSTIVVVPQTVLPAGAQDGTGSIGFGTGGFGVGGWGSPSTGDYFARTWSLAAWGQKLLASPRNGGIYEWSNVLATRAVALTAAPTQVAQILVTPQRFVMALGCTQENGTYNPLCIRHCALGDETTWATAATSSSTAREYILPGGGRIVGGKVIGRYVLVWTSTALFLGTYIGQVGQVWSFDKIGDRCGLIGPNAAAVADSTAFWMSADRQFHSYSLGGAVMPIDCPIRNDFKNNLSPAQADKVMASTNAEYTEVRWDYPDKRDGLDNSRYIAFAYAGEDLGSWYRGRPLMGVLPARTAMFDAEPALFPIGTTIDGHVYFHEAGNSADGAPLAWLATTSLLSLDPNKAILIRELWPDLGGADQVGPVNVTVPTQLYPQGPITTYGPFAVAPGQSLFDFKAEGRFAQFTFQGFSAPSFARIGRISVEGKQRGRRG